MSPRSAITSSGILVGQRKKLYEELHPETRHGAVGKHRPKSWSPQLENSKDLFTKTTGRSKPAIALAARRAGQLGAVLLSETKGSSVTRRSRRCAERTASRRPKAPVRPRKDR